MSRVLVPLSLLVGGSYGTIVLRLLWALCLLTSACAKDHHTSTEESVGGGVQVWLTTPDKAKLLSHERDLPPIPESSPPTAAPTVVHVDASQVFQEIDGFGASISDAGASLLMGVMSPPQRDELMTLLFDPVQGIGVSFLRQPVGASDLAVALYSYDDVAQAGGIDPALVNFSIDHDRAQIIPAILAAIAKNPKLKIMLTPWSPPGWMKSSGTITGGGILVDPASYKPFAQYLVRTIEAYEAAGVPIYALTTQNEPLFEANYPSMRMEWWQQSNLVQFHLGPALALAQLNTKILLFDHNWDRPDYPNTIFANTPTVRAFSAGSAFHCYAGDPSGMDSVHDRNPDKEIYVTECSGGTWGDNGAGDIAFDFHSLFIGSLRHWARTVVKYNLVLDDNHGPILPNSSQACHGCIGFATIHRDGTYSLNLDYYLMGHLSKFVQPGANRIGSDSFPGGIETVALRNPDGTTALVAFNDSQAAQAFEVVDVKGSSAFSYTLAAGAGATFVW
jgi:glucosylceramidase